MIVGAGLAGLIAAHAFPREMIHEAGSRKEMHNALLRFRTEKVARLTGIDFRRVLVRKGIWDEDRFMPPTIRAANFYSQKCLGVVRGDRSIWNIEPVERFIAPPDFYDRLVDSVENRIHWNMPVDFKDQSAVKIPCINTAPLPLVLKDLGIPPGDNNFLRSNISVVKFRIPYANAYQTVYYPAPTTSLYRASITGDILIVELVGSYDSNPNWPNDGSDILGRETLARDLEGAFGVDLSCAEYIGHTNQEYGKIVPISTEARKNYLWQLTNHHNIFSLGRFATWRNLLLDDLVDDLKVIKQLMAAHQYDIKLKGL